MDDLATQSGVSMLSTSSVSSTIQERCGFSNPSDFLQQTSISTANKDELQVVATAGSGAFAEVYIARISGQSQSSEAAASSAANTSDTRRGSLDIKTGFKTAAAATLALARKSVDIQVTGTSDSLVAVKSLKTSVDAEEVAGFVAESVLLNRLKHDNIINCIAVGFNQSTAASNSTTAPLGNGSALFSNSREFLKVGIQEEGADISENGDPDEAWRTMFLVQEYANAGSLRAMILKQMVSPSKQVYTFTEALRWSINIASALAFLHAGGGNYGTAIIHRDLKPDNILLTGPKDCLIAKVADFGLHCIQPTSKDATDPHKMTGKTGAYVYMSREVLLGLSYGPATDVFAFGVIMYELFSKRLISTSFDVVEGQDAAELYARKVAGGYRESFPTFMPKPIQELISECWQSFPNLRPTTEQIVETLKAIEATGEVQAVSTTFKRVNKNGGGACTQM